MQAVASARNVIEATFLPSRVHCHAPRQAREAALPVQSVHIY
jgi:hypothetical protein